MPDFTIEIMEMCSNMNISSFNIGGYVQTGIFSERQYPQCTCPAYKFSKRTEFFGGRWYPKPCKHIIEVEQTMCTWHGQWGISQTTPGICPECGKQTVKVRVAV